MIKASLLTNLPKADLHYHLLGGVSLQRMQEFANQYHANVSFDYLKSFYRNYQNKKNAQGGIAALKFLYKLLQNASDYEKILLDVARDAKKHNCLYIETFINPSDTSIPYKSLLKALENGCKKAQDLGVIIRILPSINREKSQSIALEMVSKVCENPSPYVVGIGMDYKEKLGDIKQFVPAYDLARKAGLKLSVHAGEFGVGVQNIHDAIHLLGANRIEHGYTILEDPSLLKYCILQKLAFSVVPTNTYYHTLYPDHATWLANQPIPKMAKAGLTLCPATDDWYIHDTNSSKLYACLANDFGFTLQNLKDLFFVCIKSSFASKEIKAELLSKYETSSL